LLWDGLNVLKWNLNVKIKNTIADYRFKPSMFGQNDWSMLSGRSLRHQRRFKPMERVRQILRRENG
jgi:hypothetical protein